MAYEIKVTFVEKGKAKGIVRVEADKIGVARYIKENYSFGLWGDDCTIVVNKK